MARFHTKCNEMMSTDLEVMWGKINRLMRQL